MIGFCLSSVSELLLSSCVTLSFFFSSRRRHTRCALVTGVQTCALPISAGCFPGLGCLYGTLPAELGAIQDDLGIRRVRSRYSAIMDSKEWGITNVLSFEPSDGITLKYIFGLRRSSYDRFTNQTTLDLPIQTGHNWQDYGRTIRSDEHTSELQSL